MPSDVQERVWSAEDIVALRQQVKSLIERKDYETAAAAAKDAQIAYSTFSAWLAGTYPGNMAKVADQVAAWLRMRETRKATLATAPAAPGFVTTVTAEAILDALAHAQHMPTMVVIVGAPGVGKTIALCRYARHTPNVCKITASPAVKSAASVLDELCFAMGIQQRGRHNMILRAIIARVRDKGMLIAVDEANWLTIDALEMLRAIRDQANCGLALVGNPAVFGRLAAEGNHGQNAQISRRITLRLQRPKPLPADIDAIIEAWGVDGAAERKLLQVIGRKPGALGRLTETLRLAHMLAAQQRTPLSIAQINAAFTMQDGTLMPGEAA